MKKEAFTLMELTIVMVVIAVLAGRMIIGFTTYINKAHETGITTDFNAPLKNPVRMSAIEDGELPTAAGTVNLADLGTATSNYFKIERGAKYYVIVADDATVVIYTTHSSKNKAVRFTLNDAKNDITIEDGTIEGNGATPEVIKFIVAS